MNEQWNWKTSNYVFNIQSPQDFYSQPNSFEQQYVINQLADEIDDLTTAKQMLEDIGVTCK